MRLVLTVIGTRPEAIKLAPILRVIDRTSSLVSRVCVTVQHTDLLEPVLSKLGIGADYRFHSHLLGDSLHESAASILQQFRPVLEEAKPDVVLVQGDTTTAFVGALAAFYSGIPVAHVEAGLRTGYLGSPWPEEGHRHLVDRLTTYFFAPTEEARESLVREGSPSDKVWVVGNTAMDALRLARQKKRRVRSDDGRMIAVTVHRRENQGKPLVEICRALTRIVEECKDVTIVVTLHPNPRVGALVRRMLSGVSRIELVEPLAHEEFLGLLDECSLVITDSGGIQEEASAIGKPVLVTRDTTERPEGVRAGVARLVGTRTEEIVSACKELLEDPELLAAMSRIHHHYGDGYSAERIVAILDEQLSCGVA
jgi:UDP-N-acetylglucosamine 2-epimerase (non-hydrolysing)